MSELSRGRGNGRAAAPVRHVHLGLGNFFRAHQAWYTERSPDAAAWGIAAFTGRSAALATTLSRQDGLYTLVTRSATEDRFEVISTVSAAHAADDHGQWLRYLADPQVRLVTLTVTEAAYLRGTADSPGSPLLRDLDVLRADPCGLVTTMPGRLVAGLAARRRADAGPLTIVSCDNLPDNGTVLAGVVGGFAERLDPTLAGWIADTAAYATTVVDRITPRTTAADLALVETATGHADGAPVITEPFAEWVLSGPFEAGRPAWEAAGAVFTDDVTPFEQRKLWMLNGAHLLLAYAASLRGHRTVADAMRDDVCRAWVEQWWDEAAAGLPMPAADLDDYRAALLSRFANPRIEHLLAQIAADGSLKLPVRILPVLRAERAAGRLPSGAIRTLAAWVCHLRGSGAPVDDPRADVLVAAVTGRRVKAAVAEALTSLDPALGADDDLVSATSAYVEEFGVD